MCVSTTAHSCSNQQASLTQGGLTHNNLVGREYRAVSSQILCCILQKIRPSPFYSGFTLTDIPTQL